MENKKVEIIPYMPFKRNCDVAINAYIKALGGCGSITRDRFGFSWIITCPNPAKQ